MAVPLNLFGYAAGLGMMARGKRRLLVVLTELDGKPPFPRTTKEYHDLIFETQPFLYDGAGNTTLCAATAFKEMSLGRFEWIPAAPQPIGPIKLSAVESGLPIEIRGSRILQIIQEGGLFDFESAGSGVNFVGVPQLGVVIFDNDPAGSGATRSAFHFWDAKASDMMPWAVMVNAAFLMPTASFNLITHELAHVIGRGTDLYGGSERLNGRISLMGPSEGSGGTLSFHLDPFHKMRYSWCEPRQLDSRSKLAPIALGSPGAMDPHAPVILFDSARGTSEYFMLEFRSPSQPASAAFDRGIASDGMAIWQVAIDQKQEPIKLTESVQIQNGQPQSREYAAVFCLGQADGSTRPMPGQRSDGFERGGNRLWREGLVTPELFWLDGSSVERRISVRWYTQQDTYIMVDFLEPRTSLPVSGPTVASSGTMLETFWNARSEQVEACASDRSMGGAKWGGRYGVSIPNQVAAGAEPVALARASGTVDVFWVGAKGEVMWASRPQGSREWAGGGVAITPPGVADSASRLRAVSRHEDHLDVFWARSDGTVQSTWRDSYAENGAWTNHLFTLAPAGTCVNPWSLAAVAAMPEELNVFWVGRDGGIWFTAFYIGADRRQRWSLPSLVVPSTSVDRRTAIGAACKDLGEIDILWQASSQQLNRAHRGTQIWNSPWTQPISVSDSEDIAPGSDIAVVAQDAWRFDVFWCSSSQDLMTVSGIRQPSGGPWSAPGRAVPTSGKKLAPGYQIGARSRTPGYVDVSFVHDDLTVGVAWFDGGWRHQALSTGPISPKP
jgi:hypothetical protein